jgi:hypothetical protein
MLSFNEIIIERSVYFVGYYYIYNKIYYETHFISNANSYMFRHQCAIVREFINNMDLYVQQVCQVVFALTSIVKVESLNVKTPDDTPTSMCKHCCNINYKQ